MSAKNLDNHSRWRNITVGFRVSPEEGALINAAVRVSGLSKQDYITRKLTDQTVIVQGNPKVFRGLQKEMKMILAELERIASGEEVHEDLLWRIDLLTSIMDGMREDNDWKTGQRK